MDKGRNQSLTPTFELLVQNGALQDFLHHKERAAVGAQLRSIRLHAKKPRTLQELAELMIQPTQKMARRPLNLGEVQGIIVAVEDGELDDVTVAWMQAYARTLGLVYGSTLTHAADLPDNLRYSKVTGK